MPRDGEDAPGTPTTSPGETDAATTELADREICASRDFDASREVVWSAWTDPQQVARWWGPRGFTISVEIMDVSPGGAWRFTMRSPEGTHIPNELSYVEVVAPERIVMDHVSAPRFRLTATFAERAGRTRVTMRLTFESAAQRDRIVKGLHADRGLRENLEKLGEHLAATGGS